MRLLTTETEFGHTKVFEWTGQKYPASIATLASEADAALFVAAARGLTEPEGLDTLGDEYEAFCREQGMEFLNAAEHLHDDAISAYQRFWLTAFCQRWDEAREAETDARYGPKVTQAEWAAFEEAASAAHQANYDARGDRYATAEELQMHLSDPLADRELVHDRLIVLTGKVMEIRGRLRTATEAEKAKAVEAVAYTDSFKEGA